MLLVVTNILTDVNSLGSDREQGGPKPGPKFDQMYISGPKWTLQPTQNPYILLK